MNTIVRKFQKQVTQRPKNIALTDGVRNMTYTELEKVSNVYASFLNRLSHISRVRYIAVSRARSIYCIVAIMAILKAGNGYIPMEPSFPKERIAYMLQESKTDAVITEEDFRTLFGNSVPVYCLEEDTINQLRDFRCQLYYPSKEDTVYVLYTSGSTGEPEGVMVSNKNVIIYVEVFEKEFSITQNDCVLQNSVRYFQFCWWEVH